MSKERRSISFSKKSGALPWIIRLLAATGSIRWMSMEIERKRIQPSAEELAIWLKTWSRFCWLKTIPWTSN